MNRRVRSALILVIFSLSMGVPIPEAYASRGSDEIVKSRNYSPLTIATSSVIQQQLDAIVAETLAAYKAKGLKPEELSVTVIDMTDQSSPVSAAYRGESPLYPASVVKMFYMAALHQQLEDGKVRLTPELERGLRDMIVDSSNEATQYILDVLTDTSSGAELPKKQFDKWQFKRNRVNRYFASMGYTNINVNQKTFCEDAYGIEQQSRNYKGQNRNMITTNASARLIAEIAAGRSVSEQRSRMMMELLKRDPFAPEKSANSQAVDFAGKVLRDRKLEGARLWSKAGWTSKSRHDAAYIELADGRKFAIAIFTENHANEVGILPEITGKVIDRLRKERTN